MHTDTPEYNWLPPVWDRDKPDLTTDRLNQPTAPVFHPSPLHGANTLAAELTALKARFPDTIDHVNGTREVEPTVDADKATPLTLVPHPKSDFGHVDPDVYKDGSSGSADEKGRFCSAIAAVEALQTLAARDGTMEKTIGEALPPLRRAGELLAPNARGLKRLTLVFENNLCKLTVLYGKLNEALEMENEAGGKIAYNIARQNYIQLLKDLDDHEPRFPTPGGLGYGRAFKWIYVRPLIHEGKIKGAKIVAKWNPHMSSSGIPLPHG